MGADLCMCCQPSHHILGMPGPHGCDRSTVDNVTAMEGIAGYFTALGLSTAAGLNAYIPILSVGLLSRYTDLIDLPAPWDALADPIVLGIVGVVGIADFIGDKVPVVDHVLHAIGLAVAPVVGGLLALASASAFDLDPGVAAGLGITAALVTHAGRAAARPLSTAATGGGGNPVGELRRRRHLRCPVRDGGVLARGHRGARRDRAGGRLPGVAEVAAPPLAVPRPAIVPGPVTGGP